MALLMNALPSNPKAWIIAARPQTLPAGVAPVLVGTGIAIDKGYFAIGPAIAAFLGAILIQIGTNFANDYYDAMKGADTEEREGFTRVTQSGLIPPKQVRWAMILTFGLAMLDGIYLVLVGGMPILIIGIASIIAGIAYTGGPLPLGYLGLGDVFVFVFFGVIAVIGTVYVQAVTTLPQLFPLGIHWQFIPSASIISSIAIGCITTNILVVNNIRDIETDKEAGKKTLAVRLGYRFSRLQYLSLLGIAYAVPIWLFVNGYSWAILLPEVTLPFAVILSYNVFQYRSGEKMDEMLKQTGMLLTSFSVFLTIGFIV
ncbi:MAG: 1,4-dihydroxy-2-naphthoate polyprenyltransferase [Halobacteriaceae archaeon]